MALKDKYTYAKHNQGGRKKGENRTYLNRQTTLFVGVDRRLSLHLTNELHEYYQNHEFTPNASIPPNYWALQAFCVYYPAFLSLSGNEHWVTCAESLMDCPASEKREGNKPWNLRLPYTLWTWLDSLPSAEAAMIDSGLDWTLRHKLVNRLGEHRKRAASMAFHCRRALFLYRKIVEEVDPILKERGVPRAAQQNFLLYEPEETYNFFMTNGVDFSKPWLTS